MRTVAMMFAGVAMTLGACGGSDCPPPVTCPVCQEPVAQAPAPAPGPTGPMVEEWIQLPVRILFTTSSGELSAENRAVLDEAVATMRSREDIVRIRIEGHTDTRGGDGSNAELSRERAESVREYLVSRGVPGNMLEVEGYGDTRPLVFEAGRDQNRAQNRRVEFSALIRRPASEAGQGF